MLTKQIAAKRVNIVSVKLVKESSISYKSRKINSPADVADLLRDFIGDPDREMMIVVCLDTKSQPTNISIVSIGTLNSSLVHPRELFKIAILANSNSIIIAHNHPSSDTTPSQEDIQVTKRLVAAGEILGIEILDHVILGDNQYASLKERGVI